MATSTGIQLTKAGEALLAKIHTGGRKLEITQFVIGDEVWTDEDIEAREHTTLKNERLRAPVMDIVTGTGANAGRTICTGTLVNTDVTEPFYVREIGIMALDPDTGEELLYLIDPIAKGAPSTVIEANAMSQVIPIRMELAAVSREQVELVITDSWLFATNEQALEGVLKDRALSPATLGYVFDERVQKPLDIKIDEVNAKLAEAAAAIIKASTIAAPIGIVYMQLAGMAAPADLWGGTWSNISSSFAGRFFRAEGGNAAAFGSNQADAIRQLSFGFTVLNDAGAVGSTGGMYWNGSGLGGTACDTAGGSSGSLRWEASRQVATAAEIRPINSTTRIWQRVA